MIDWGWGQAFEEYGPSGKGRSIFPHHAAFQPSCKMDDMLFFFLFEIRPNSTPHYDTSPDIDFSTDLWNPTRDNSSSKPSKRKSRLSSCTRKSANIFLGVTPQTGKQTKASVTHCEHGSSWTSVGFVTRASTFHDIACVYPYICCASSFRHSVPVRGTETCLTLGSSFRSFVFGVTSQHSTVWP